MFSQELNLKILEIDTSFYPVIKVGFVASEEKAKLIENIKKENLELFEGKKRVTNFSINLTKSNSILRLAVALDISTSMKGEKFNNAKIAISELLKVLGGNVEIAFLTFGSEVHQISNFSTDYSFIEASLKNINLSPKTKLYDGLLESAKFFSSFEKTRNAIILITDGKDDGSYSELKTAIEKAKKNYVEVYSIGVGKNVDLAALGKISQETGGIVYNLINTQDLRYVLQNIFRLLSFNYQITFSTPDSIVEFASTKRSLGIIANYDNIRKTEEKEYVVPKYNPERGINFNLLVLIIVSILIITLLVILINLIIKKRGNNKLDYSEFQFKEEDSNKNNDNNYFNISANYNQNWDHEFEGDTDDEFLQNISEEKTIVINKGRFSTASSIGYLVMNSKTLGQHIYEIRQNEIIIGRESMCDILLNDDQVSKIHTKISVQNGIFFVDDLGSSNGTLLDGEEIHHAELKNNSKINICGHEFIMKIAKL